MPSGRYLAPPDSIDCVETIRGEGQCGVQSLVVGGPMFKQFDISVVKRFDLFGSTNAEFRFDVLNAFNNANFIPVGGLGSVLNNYEVDDLTGNNLARVVQIVTRINW